MLIYISLGFAQDNILGETIDAISKNLFDSKQIKVCWVLNSNSESLSLIANQNQVIVFDSHKNERQLVSDRERLKALLIKKIDIDGGSIGQVSYALGTCQPNPADLKHPSHHHLRTYPNKDFR